MMATRGQAFTFELQGIKELDRMLAELPKAMSKTVMRNALKKAGAPIRNEAAQKAPAGPTGNFKKSIVVSTKLKRSQKSMRRRDEAEVFVGSTAPHAHLIEFGTRPRYWKNSKLTGQMPANPFFRNAWDATKDKALKILQVEVWKELEKAVRRLRKRAEKGTLSKSATRALFR